MAPEIAENSPRINYRQILWEYHIITEPIPVLLSRDSGTPLEGLPKHHTDTSC
ncbi:hypothetical protein [Methanogenium sp. MK-MG]|uniref:hypothetical protein n=1 Tax=Methanogenium sp. MK-MG TaxID=2599926 RepID=UPI0013E9FF19|nr:hypothetical protein [Methanogenium sp. MK-MG]